MSHLRTKLATTAAVLAASIGGVTIANAATTGSTGATGSTAAPSAAQVAPGPHTVGGKAEEALAGTTAAKVRAAALAKVPGTVDRVETNVDGSAPYEAHITKADGTQVEVQVAQDFSVAAVNAMPGHP